MDRAGTGQTFTRWGRQPPKKAQDRAGHLAVPPVTLLGQYWRHTTAATL